ncbi:hypothetical protein [Serratia fonticola]|uniref:Uncharacterized protein n=1 Tax=Serratia fonticola TaxID=47917 RepID=A0AAW3X008_SERFO|nr:hypothetical protein [Serratia fonticola]MBC3215798.1 hypothetical protein [Serratia fonticola]NYA16347.1 hypothetical protein [Serratia fonticola]NYA36454.1 hypothetical protein [Serratia fonticola]
MKDETDDYQNELQFIPWSSSGISGARTIALSALHYYNFTQQDSQAETRGFFSIIGIILGLASGLTSLIGGMSENTALPERERVRLKIKVRNLSRHNLIIIDNHSSNSRITSSLRIAPGETLEYVYAVGSSLPSASALTFMLVPDSNQLPTTQIHVNITDGNGHVRVNRVSFNGTFSETQLPPEASQRDVSAVFYNAAMGNMNIHIIPTTFTNNVEGKLDLAILSP